MPLTPGGERFLFVCSLKCLFQETQAYGAGGAGAVFGWYVFLPLLSAWLSVVFFSLAPAPSWYIGQ